MIRQRLPSHGPRHTWRLDEPESGGDGQIEVGGREVDRARRRGHAGRGRRVVAGAEVALPAGVGAARDDEADAVAGGEAVRDRIELELDGAVGLAGPEPPKPLAHV